MIKLFDNIQSANTDLNNGSGLLTHAPQKKSLLYLDMAHTYEVAKREQRLEFFRARESGGYFGRIWSVHLLSDVATKKKLKKTELIRFTPWHLIIEGCTEKMSWPKFLFPLNFIVSQVQLFFLLVRILRKNNISGIFSTCPHYGGLIALCLRWIAKKPLIVYIIANYDQCYEVSGMLALPRLLRWRFLEQLISRFVFSKADLVIGGNKNNLQYAFNNGAKAETSALFPTSKHTHKCHLIDPEKRTRAEEIFTNFNIPLKRSYLLSVGRLIPMKHPDDTLKAMKVVMDQDPSVIGIFAGDGPMREQLQQMVRSFGLIKNIFFLGNIVAESLSQIIPQCITLSPITGMALIECGLGGSPVVAYDRDWQSEFVINGANGYIVNSRDYEEMGRKAFELIQNHTLRKSFSLKIRETALRYADRDKLYSHEQAVYDNLFNSFEKQ